METKNNQNLVKYKLIFQNIFKLNLHKDFKLYSKKSMIVIERFFAYLILFWINNCEMSKKKTC